MWSVLFSINWRVYACVCAYPRSSDYKFDWFNYFQYWDTRLFLLYLNSGYSHKSQTSTTDCGKIVLVPLCGSVGRLFGWAISGFTGLILLWAGFFLDLMLDAWLLLYSAFYWGSSSLIDFGVPFGRFGHSIDHFTGRWGGWRLRGRFRPMGVKSSLPGCLLAVIGWSSSIWGT